MTDSIPAADWIEVADREYLSNFINYGGSSVKFTVSSQETRAGLQDALRSLSRQRNFQFIELEASQCRVYMPQDIFLCCRKAYGLAVPGAPGNPTIA